MSTLKFIFLLIMISIYYILITRSVIGMSKQDINRLFAKNILHYLKLNKMTQAELAP